MISVIIPTLNAERCLSETLTALVPAAVDGLIREAIVVDGGSRDRTLAIVEAAGAELVRAGGGTRQSAGGGGRQGALSLAVVSSCRYGTGPGLGTRGQHFMERVDTGARAAAAAAFRFALDDMVQDPACWSGWWRFAALH